MPDLLELARAARLNAFAPYSHFAVGAALLADDGRVFTGCNIENATYGLTVCAERVAVFKAVSEGARKFTGIAVITGADTLTSPCGACRQILWEFAGNIPVLLTNLKGARQEVAMRVLFPLPCDDGSLK